MSARLPRSASPPTASRRKARSLFELAAVPLVLASLALGSNGAEAHPETLPAGAPDLARSWVIESFEVDVRVLVSGALAVTETIRPRFEGSFNGIYRDIPIDYRSPRGFSYKLRLSVESVTDDAGRELEYELSRERQYRRIKVWIPGAVDATRTVVIRYRVENGIRFFDADGEGIEEAYDELYWNVTGDEWTVPIESASASVRLPSQITGLQAHAFTGAFGSRERAAEVRVEGSTISVRALRALGPLEGLTVGVKWDPGVIRRPTAVDKGVGFVRANWLLVIPFLAFGFMYRRWNARGRDPEQRPIAPQYAPPEGLTPAEVGVIADNRVDMRDVTATIVDLAVRGYLVIEATDEEKLFGLVKDRSYEFRLRRSREEWSGLLTHERKLLRAMFGRRSGDHVRLSELENKFYKNLSEIKDDLMDSLIEHNVYVRRPDHVRGRYVAGGIIAGFLLVVFGMVAGPGLGIAPLAAILSGLGTGAAVIGFGVVMPARTVAGARTLEKVRGFEEFLERVELDRFKRMITGPEMFEKYLPFAMALGLEKKWAAAFAEIYREPPGWYRGTGGRGFHPSLFVADLGQMSTQTASAMSSSPRSSGGSSFGGGGGFSGGGFGGGGGGAF